MKNLISFGAGVSIFASGAFGTFGVTVDVGNLQNAGGAALVETGMLYLVSSGADGEFSLPEAGVEIGAGSDDAIVTSWDLTTEVSQGGEYIVGVGDVDYTGLAEGDLLAILWFPNLTEASNDTPGVDEAYGFYRSENDGGGDSWMIPTDGTLLHSLKFFAGDSSPLVSQSDVPPFLAAATFAAGEDAGPPVINLAGLSTGEPNPGTVTFGWTGSTAQGGGFRVERRLGTSGDWTVLGNVGEGVVSFDDPNIGRGKNYQYRLAAINGFGSETTSAQSIETLKSSLINLATRGILGTGENVLIVGFSFGGTGDINLLARTQGPEMDIDSAGLGPDDVAADPSSGLYLGPSLIQENDDWGDTQLEEIKALFSPRTIAQPNSDEASKDSAMILSHAAPKTLTIISQDIQGLSRLALVEVFDTYEGSPNDAPTYLTNLATRGFVGTGSGIMIGGFTIAGEVDMKLLLRGKGPSLPAAIVNPLLDPKLTLYKGSEVIGFNDNWEDDGAAADVIAVSDQVGAANYATGSKDSALVTTLSPGLYTFFLQGIPDESIEDDGTGVGLIEVFLAD